jgi:hypothetical protein
MDKDKLDIAVLKALREKFLHKPDGLTADYWQSRTHLEQYHATFARRIGWKWKSVLDGLAESPSNQSPEEENQGLNPHPVRTDPPPTIVDFGCGTGIAAIEWARKFHVDKVQFWDRSVLSAQFAAEQFEAARGTFVNPLAECEVLKRQPGNSAGTFVLLSHIVSELTQAHRTELLLRLRTADGFCWVEPGTPQSSQRLVEIRRSLLDTFRAIAPCPHQGMCGLEKTDKAWCHHFATPPQEVFQSAFWKKFSDELSIDLRSLPTSYLVMRKPAAAAAERLGAGAATDEAGSTASHQILGRPRDFKGYSQFWLCSEGKVEERRILHRKNPALVKQLQKYPFSKKWSAEELQGSSALPN